MHPPFTVQGFGSAFFIVPVTDHDRIAPSQQLTSGTWRNGVSFLIHDSYFDVRVHATHSGHSTLNGIINGTLETDGAGFSHAISNGDLVHVHVMADTFHQFHGAR